MLVTEQEAKRRWCPFVRNLISGQGVTGGAQIGFNRVNGGMTLDATCMGSRCMAWRWSIAHRFDVPAGYCGLAGRPETDGGGL